MSDLVPRSAASTIPLNALAVPELLAKAREELGYEGSDQIARNVLYRIFELAGEFARTRASSAL